MYVYIYIYIYRMQLGRPPALCRISSLLSEVRPPRASERGKRGKHRYVYICIKREREVYAAPHFTRTLSHPLLRARSGGASEQEVALALLGR